MVAWFTVVVEANCVRQPVSLLFPHSGIRKREGNNKEPTSLQLASEVPMQPCRVTTLWLKQPIIFFLRVYAAKKSK